MQLVLDLDVPDAGQARLRLTGAAASRAYTALHQPPGEAGTRQLVAKFAQGVHLRTHDSHAAVVTSVWRDMVVRWHT